MVTAENGAVMTDLAVTVKHREEREALRASELLLDREIVLRAPRAMRDCQTSYASTS